MIKIKEYIFQNKEKVALTVLGMAAVGGLLYWLTKKPQQQPKQTIIIPQQINQSKVSATSTAQHHEGQEPVISEYDKKLSQIINQIRRIFIKTNDQITPEAITAIIEAQYALSRDQVKAIILKSRKQRRAKLDDPLEYANIITKHQLELQELQQKHLGVILARFNIDKVTWKDASQKWESQCQKEDEGISELIRKQQQKQLLSLLTPGSKPKDFKFISNVLKQKIKNLSNLNPDQLGVRLGTDEAARYDMIETYINDLINKQFKVEPQDLQLSIEQFSKEEKEKVILYEDQIAQLMEKLIEAEEDDKEGEEVFA